MAKTLAIPHKYVKNPKEFPVKDSDKTYTKYPVQLPIYNEKGEKVTAYRFLVNKPGTLEKPKDYALINVPDNVTVEKLNPKLIGPDGKYLKRADVGLSVEEAYEKVKMTSDELINDWDASKKNYYAYLNATKAAKAAEREGVEAPDEPDAADDMQLE